MNKVASQPLFNIKHSIILSLHRQSTPLEDLLRRNVLHIIATCSCFGDWKEHRIGACITWAPELKKRMSAIKSG